MVSELLKNCPCCGNEAEFHGHDFKDGRWWQLVCNGCGLSGEMDKDKAFVLERWNRREPEQQKKMWITLLAVLLPIVAVSFYLLGVWMGQQVLVV